MRVLKTKKIRIVGLMLVLAMLFSCMGVFAEENSEVLSIINNLMLNVIKDQEGFGVPEADLSAYTVYSAFQTQYINDVDKKADYTIYPIADANNVVILTATEAKASDGSTVIQIGNDYVDSLSLIATLDSEIALINAENGTEFISRDNIYNRSMDNNNYNNIDFSNMSVINSVDVASMVMPLADTGKVLSIPNRTQGSNNNLCWAACVSSVGQYKTGVTKSIFKIADENGIGYDEGATISETARALAFTSFKVYNNVESSPLYYIKIKSNVNLNKPTISHMDLLVGSSTLASHAVTVCGFSSTSSGDTITYMEPRGGVKRTVNKSSSGRFEFSEYSSEYAETAHYISSGYIQLS